MTDSNSHHLETSALFSRLPAVREGNSFRAEVSIALRHLMSKRSEAMVSIVTFVSVIGVLAAVSIVHVVLGVMSGFQEDLREKLLGTNAHITIQNMDQSEQSFGLIENYEEVIAHANSVDGVLAASPFLFSKTFIQTPTGVDWVVVKGVDPKRVSLVSDLPQQICHMTTERMSRWMRTPYWLLWKGTHKPRTRHQE